MCITNSVRWGVWTSPISSLTGLCFSAIVQWRLFASPNKFGDEVVWCIESVHWWVSTSAYQFPDEVVRSRESICWRVCASVNQFADELCIPEAFCWGVYALPTSPLTRFCGLGNQFADESVLQHFSSLTSLWFSESGPWRVGALVNQLIDEVMWCIKSVRWQVLASATHFLDEVMLSRESVH